MDSIVTLLLGCLAVISVVFIFSELDEKQNIASLGKYQKLPSEYLIVIPASEFNKINDEIAKLRTKLKEKSLELSDANSETKY